MMVTAMPALAKLMAMPPPMVPAPITAARASGRGLVDAGMSGTRAASRSAKNTWRCALDSSLTTSSRNSACSRASPSSNGSWNALRTDSTQADCARLPRARPTIFAAASS